MGDRVLIQLKCGEEYAPCSIYSHWGGHEILETIQEASRFMRAHDLSYATARLIGHLCHKAGIDGSLGVGVNQPIREDQPDLYDQSPGDAGILFVDTASGVAVGKCGYLVDPNGKVDYKEWLDPKTQHTYKVGPFVGE